MAKPRSPAVPVPHLDQDDPSIIEAWIHAGHDINARTGSATDRMTLGHHLALHGHVHALRAWMHAGGDIQALNAIEGMHTMAYGPSKGQRITSEDATVAVASGFAMKRTTGQALTCREMMKRSYPHMSQKHQDDLVVSAGIFLAVRIDPSITGHRP